MIRLIRVAKLYKNASKAIETDQESKIDKLQLLLNDHKESHVGKELGEMITIKVVIVVLSMIFVSPAFHHYQYVDLPLFFEFGL